MHTIIAGRKPVIEALKAGTRIEEVVFLTGVQGNVIREIRDLAERRQVKVVQANKQQFRELATNATTQGVVAVVPTKSFGTLEDVLAVPSERAETGFLLVLDEIEDPHNLGALVRTAECAGVHGIILPRHHSASVTTSVVKTSAGATEHMAMAEVINVVQTLERLKEEGYWIVGLDGTAAKLFTEVDYTTPTALVVGNEGRGIRRLVREHCDILVRIPLHGKIESLNASVAGALAMYEVARGREKMAGASNEAAG
jgi:23S rRNA (guanosine2251-2'-O)-methyltransferase